jgi:hypothetical protein
MGVNPLSATATQMPRVESTNHAAGTVTFTYQRAKSASGVNLGIEATSNLAGAWSPAQIVSTQVVEDGGDWERVQTVVTVPSATRTFLRLKAVAP